MDEGLFSRRMAIGLGVFGVISLLTGLAAAIFWSAPDVISSGRDGFSSSALGHRAFVELLERAGYEVLLSRGRSAMKAREGALLVVLEPGAQFRTADDEPQRLEAMLGETPQALIALPKWKGREDPTHPGWLESIEWTPVEQPEAVLNACGATSAVVRAEQDAPPEVWGSSSFGAQPTLEHAQLVDWGGLEPWIAADRGVLLGRVEREDGHEHFVLSDPDLLSNHGLGRAENAELILEVVARIVPPGRAIIIDETLHGFVVVENVWAALGRFPLVLVMLQGAIVGAVLLWCGTRRFGQPLPAGLGLARGKLVLIESTSELLLHAGRTRPVLGRYFAQHVRRVARAFHLSPALKPKERRAELARLEGERRPRVELDQVEEAVHRATGRSSRAGLRTLRAARLIKKWSEEMLHGAR